MLKRLTTTLAALAALAAGTALAIHLAGIPRYVPAHLDLQVRVTAERVARGRLWANLLCIECHLSPETGRLTGRHVKELPTEFGEIYSRNITRDAQHGVGSYTDGELAVLLRTGVTPDGRYLPPYMEKLNHLSDEDLASVIAFLRSDDPLVKADPTVSLESNPSLLVKLLSRTVFKPFPMPDHPIEIPPATDPVARGAYWVHTVDCYTCHSADFKTMDNQEPTRSEGYMGGGNLLTDAGGMPVYAPNLTMDEATGIGTWSQAQFIRAVREGFSPDGHVLVSPMSRYAVLPEVEVAAIFAYLKTVPVIRKARPPRHVYSVPSATASRGQTTFYTYGCVACHGPTGKSTFDLTRTNTHYPSDADLRRWILNASSIKPDTKMPTWQGILPEADVAPLMEHVRDLSARAGDPRPQVGLP
ncbi:MAG TPA: cytochrome c [Myxococcota bacterium]|nr:cytochrome c [Myxococcota bacterium]